MTAGQGTHISLQLSAHSPRFSVAQHSDSHPNFLGFIINITDASFFGRLFTWRHWLCVRKVGDQLFWLDSNEDLGRPISVEELDSTINELAENVQVMVGYSS